MHIFLHGDNIEASRNEYFRLKQNMHGKDIRMIDGKNSTESLFFQALESSSMFSDHVGICLENIISAQMNRTNTIKTYIKKINEVPILTDILCWEGKEVKKEYLSVFTSQMTIQVFLYPKQLFQLLDALKPDNAKQLLLLLKTNEKVPMELLFSMIITRVRQLIQIKDTLKPAILQSWQLQRLTNQAGYFTMHKLLDMHRKLQTIDYSIKTSTSPFTLIKHIELFCCSI